MSAANPSASMVAQTNAVSADLLDYLSALPAEGWRRPSDCAGWTVAMVVAHLTSAGSTFSDSVERGLRGDGGPPAYAAAGQEAYLARRARELDRLTSLQPQEQIAELRPALAAMGAALARVEAEAALGGGRTTQSDPRRAWHRLGPQLLDWYLGQWLVELSLHDWDLRAAADPEAEINPAARPGLGPQMRARMPRCFKPDEPTGLQGVIRIDLDGNPSCAWLGRIAEGALTLLEHGAAEPNATIHTDPGAYALVQTSRRPASRYVSRGRWQIEGDATLATSLTAAFKGY